MRRFGRRRKHRRRRRRRREATTEFVADWPDVLFIERDTTPNTMMTIHNQKKTKTKDEREGRDAAAASGVNERRGRLFSTALVAVGGVMKNDARRSVGI